MEKHILELAAAIREKYGLAHSDEIAEFLEDQEKVLKRIYADKAAHRWSERWLDIEMDKFYSAIRKVLGDGVEMIRWDIDEEKPVLRLDKGAGDGL